MENFPLGNGKLYKLGVGDPTLYKFVDFEFQKSTNDTDNLDVILVFEDVATGAIFKTPINSITSYSEISREKVAA